MTFELLSLYFDVNTLMHLELVYYYYRICVVKFMFLIIEALRFYSMDPAVLKSGLKLNKLVVH